MSKDKQNEYRAMLHGLMELSDEFLIPQVPTTDGNWLYDVFFQLRLDHPEIFWAVGFKYRYYKDSPNLILIPEYIFDKNKIREHQKALGARVDKLVRTAMKFSEWDKEKYVHDFICENIRYDKLKKPYSHEIIGPLGHGVGVCEGIAKSVKVLCDALGVWCIIAICGNNPEKGIKYRHTWNIVRINGQYYHLDATFDNTLGKNEDGSVSKLSKRHGSTSFQGLLEDGYLAPVITNYIALLGWCPKDNQEIFSLKELEEAFSIDGISKSPAVFDYDKLLWFNGEYIRKMSGEEFRTAAMPYYKEIFGDAEKPYNVLDAILQPRILKFKEIPSLLGFFKELPEYSADLFINKKSKATLENAPVMLRAAIETLSAIENWQVDTIHDALIALAQSLEVKNGTLLWPVRIAAAGQTVTPGGAMEILAVLGKEEALRRLQLGLQKIENA